MATGKPNKSMQNARKVFSAQAEELRDGLPMATPPDFARKAAEQRFAEALRKVGYSELAAEATARSCPDPTDARNRLSFPSRKRVPGAVVEFITVPVWVPMVCEYPLNYRQAALHSLPITERESVIPVIGEAEAAPDGRPELILRVPSGEHLMEALTRARENLLDGNPWQESIEEQGILEPVTLVPLTLSHADGRKDVAVLCSIDGSTRTASGQSILGVEPGDSVYRFPLDERRFKQKVAEVGAIAMRPPAGVSEKDKAKARVLTMPANIITGVNITDGGDFLRVVMSIVGQIHVEPPRRWGPAGELDAQADFALKELVASEKIASNYSLYFAGKMTMAEAKAAGMPEHQDERALFVLIVFTNNQYVCSRGIRRIIPKGRLEWAEVADVAAELAARGYRGRLNVGEAATARAALQRIFRRVEFRDAPFRMSRRSPEELRDSALAELGKGKALGPERLELAHLAAYHLTRWRQLRRPARQDDATDPNTPPDIREPDVVLRTMIGSEFGIRVLYQAVADGRRGLAPKQVSPTGQTVVGSDGKAVDMTDMWLRRTVAPEPKKQDPKPAPKATPAQMLAMAKALLANLITTQLEPALQRVKAIQADTGGALVEKVGWTSEQADEYGRVLNKASNSLHHWAEVWRQSNEDGAVDSEDA